MSSAVNERSIFIGFDPRESAAFAVARHSIKKWLTQPIPIQGLVQSDLRAQNLYWRKEEVRANPKGTGFQRYDVISDAPMSTQFSLTRFIVPYLAQTGWALFIDCDMLARPGCNLVRLFEYAETQRHKALLCVQHDYAPKSDIKMDGQAQTKYARKNWSSVMLFNCDHPANKSLTIDLVNNASGKFLHQFGWLSDNDIGAIGREWNFLVGEYDEKFRGEAKLLHYTLGTPDMPGYEDCEFAQEWRDELDSWAL
jgi:hypothetical protein